jgi:hypothetical protein
MNAPTFISWKPFFTIFLLFAFGCEEKEAWVEDPAPYLETAEFPGYFQRIPLFGENGHNGLKPVEKETHYSVYGIYVGGTHGAFVRTFNDSVLFHIPLKENLPYSSEVTVVQVNGEAVQDGGPLLSEVDVVFSLDFAEAYQKVTDGYPKLIDKIAGAVHEPKSKLDLKSIKTFHCAASEGKLLIFGRTYDLMYEFDLAFLFEKEDKSFQLKHIFARHFFKGE